MNTKSNSAAPFRYFLFSLAVSVVLYFFPWFSSNIDNSVLDSTNIITGPHISKYSTLLSQLAGNTLGGIATAGLTALKFSYFLPSLAVIALLTSLLHKRIGAVLTILLSVLHISIPLLFLFLPDSMNELISLMFVVLPTVYLYGVAGLVGLIASILFLIRSEPRRKKSKKKKTPRQKSRRELHTDLL